jgi:hypothetical protein
MEACEQLARLRAKSTEGNVRQAEALGDFDEPITITTFASHDDFDWKAIKSNVADLRQRLNQDVIALDGMQPSKTA